MTVDCLTGPVLWVEGIIGGGKSTIAEKLAGLLNFRPFHEPVEPDHLEAFYKDPKGKAFEFQIRQLVRRANIHQLAFWEANNPGQFRGAVLDRGLPGDRVFCKMHLQKGNITELQWNTYELAFNRFMMPIRPPALLMFLDVDPTVALERVKNRNRGAESGMNLEYLSDLRKGYLDLISEIESRNHQWSNGIHVWKVAWNQDHQQVGPIAEELKHRLRLN